MKILLTVLAALPFVVTLAPAEAHESPFACNRLALTAQQRKRHFDELSPKLRERVVAVGEVPDGYEFEFPQDRETYQLLAEWVGGERLCCPFFDIDLRLDREAGPLRLRLSGRPGTREFIRSDFARWFKK